MHMNQKFGQTSVNNPQIRKNYTSKPRSGYKYSQNAVYLFDGDKDVESDPDYKEDDVYGMEGEEVEYPPDFEQEDSGEIDAYEVEYDDDYTDQYAEVYKIYDSPLVCAKNPNLEQNPSIVESVFLSCQRIRVANLNIPEFKTWATAFYDSGAAPHNWMSRKLALELNSKGFKLVPTIFGPIIGGLRLAEARQFEFESQVASVFTVESQLASVYTVFRPETQKETTDVEIRTNPTAFENLVEDFFTLEGIGVKDSPTLNNGDLAFEGLIKSITRDETGCYVVGWLRKSPTAYEQNAFYRKATNPLALSK
uniref:Uncharacterized protein n=1 Tax=Acrobeloides nanus TaxID=290746 RepID=A0A914EPR2_9BILA